MIMFKLAEKLKTTKEQFTAKVSQAVENIIPAAIREERWQICQSCPHLYKPSSTCKKCGCFMTAKTYLPGVSCPIGKWGPYIKPEEENK